MLVKNGGKSAVFTVKTNTEAWSQTKEGRYTAPSIIIEEPSYGNSNDKEPSKVEANPSVIICFDADSKGFGLRYNQCRGTRV